MTLPAATPRSETAGDGIVTEFSFPHLFFANDDLTVILVVDATGVETTQTITTHYTVSGAGVASGGTVTMITPPAVGETLVIIREEQFTQGLDLVENDPFPSDTVEQAFDTLTMLCQQLNTEISRSVKLSPGDTSGASVTLPAPTASQFLGWSADALSIINLAGTTEVPVSAFMETVLDDTTAAAARTTLGAGTLDDVVSDPTPQLGGFLDPNSNYIGRAKGADIASADPLVVGTDGDYFDVTGTTGFAAMTVAADRHFFLQFDGALTLTHHATNLDLPGEANITTAAGDVAECFSTGANTVQVVNYTKADGTAVVVASSGITLGTEQATTSGTAFDFTGIPSGTKRIIVTFEDVSLSGTDSILVQIGDAGGIEVTTYVATSASIAGASSSTAGFNIRAGGAANLVSGQMILTLTDAASFQWVSSHSAKISTTEINTGGGNKALSAELTQLRITRTGSDTFDAGSVNIMYE